MTGGPELVFLLEEASAQAMLEALVPRLVPSEVRVRFVAFEGKSDLEKQLVRRIARYANPAARFIVMRDKDAGDCKVIKSRLVDLCRQAGRPDTVVRIACCELESFYLADLAAVDAGLREGPGLAGLQDRRKYRNPDRLAKPSDELIRLTKQAYQKVSGSRAIGPHLDPDNTRSASFGHLVSAIRRLAAEIGAPPP